MCIRDRVYTPEYASGFDIKGADGKKSVLVTVTNPWQGADSITTNLFIARDDEEVPADFTGQMLKGDEMCIRDSSEVGEDIL